MQYLFSESEKIIITFRLLRVGGAGVQLRGSATVLGDGAPSSLADRGHSLGSLHLPPFAVPYKIFGLTLFLDFIDRGAINQLAYSATGSAR